MAQFKPLRIELIAQLKQHGFTKKDQLAVRLCLEESVSNALRHGNQSDPNKTANVRWSVRNDAIEFSVEDQGDGFDESSVADPTLPENIERDGGRGLLLMRHDMHEVHYEQNGTRVTMRRYRRCETALGG